MKNNDFEYISSKFEDEKITAPDSLSVNSVMSRIDNKDSKIVPINKRKNMKKTAKTILSAVACLLVFAVSVSSFAIYGDNKIKNNDEVSAFKNYNQVERTVASINRISPSAFFTTNEISFGGSKFDSAAMEATTDSIDPSFSQTNIQVDGVDEADVIKTDGKYIYILNRYGVDIYIANGKKSEKVGSVVGYKGGFSDMYLYGDKLIVISGADVNYDDKKSAYSSIVSLYDISDKTSPVLENQFSQRGAYNSSRMIGKYLYLISSYYVYSKKDCIPYVLENEKEYSNVPCGDIYCLPNPDSSGFVVVSAIDVENSKTKKKTKAFLGSNEQIYCSRDNLYLLNSFWKNSKNGMLTDNTNIVKISLDGLNLDFKGKACVRGAVDEQYSLDESNGYLRIATTDSYANNLYILDDKMKQVGSVEGYAQNEEIKAVRYVGDYAYVITFEETDPLFVIDLRDAKNPVISGYAKITGFSDVLYPVDENTLLGIGYGENRNKAKVVLFDVKNKNVPKVLDFKEYDYESAAQSSVKGLLVNREKGYFGFAYSLAHNENYIGTTIKNDDYDYNGGVLTFKVDNGKIKQTNNFTNDYGIYLNRCVYIGDTIYALDLNDEMLAFEVK